MNALQMEDVTSGVVLALSPNSLVGAEVFMEIDEVGI
jgi:hypothetical protein